MNNIINWKLFKRKIYKYVCLKFSTLGQYLYEAEYDRKKMSILVVIFISFVFVMAAVMALFGAK